MLISERRQFIFIHIPKTAGTTLMEIFLPYSRLRDRIYHGYRPTRKLIRIAIDHCGWNAGRTAITGFHKHCQAVEVRDRLGSERYASFFAFSFVRNPFDLIESCYHFIRQAKALPQHRRVSKMSFPEYVEWHISRKPLRQIDYLSDPKTGELLVDFIGRFETLEEDIATITNHLEIPYTGALPHRNLGKLRQLDAPKSSYDEHLRGLVSDYFAADLKTFGYDTEACFNPEAARWTNRRASEA